MITETSRTSPKIILYQPEIAQNLGAILRLCSCFGVRLEVIEPCGFPFSSKALKRVIMDYGEVSSVVRHTSFHKYCDQISSISDKSRMILFSTKGNKCIWNFKFNSGDHLFFGNEGHGVPENVAQKADAKVFIPMLGQGRSLNLAMSAGIALGEVTRQLLLKENNRKP